MSAYVCDDKTINRIVSMLFHAEEYGGATPYPQPDTKLQEAMGYNPAEFGRALYAMNVNAVEQCYPDCIGNPDNLPGVVDDEGHHVPYKYSRIAPPHYVQGYKSIQNYLYQCSEGDVDSLPLYNLLREYQISIAVHALEKSKEYEKAEWG